MKKETAAAGGREKEAWEERRSYEGERGPGDLGGLPTIEGLQPDAPSPPQPPRLRWAAALHRRLCCCPPASTRPPAADQREPRRPGGPPCGLAGCDGVDAARPATCLDTRLPDRPSRAASPPGRQFRCKRRRPVRRLAKARSSSAEPYLHQLCETLKQNQPYGGEGTSAGVLGEGPPGEGNTGNGTHSPQSPPTPPPYQAVETTRGG